MVYRKRGLCELRQLVGWFAVRYLHIIVIIISSRDDRFAVRYYSCYHNVTVDHCVTSIVYRSGLRIKSLVVF